MLKKCHITNNLTWVKKCQIFDQNGIVKCGLATLVGCRLGSRLLLPEFIIIKPHGPCYVTQLSGNAPFNDHFAILQSVDSNDLSNDQLIAQANKHQGKIQLSCKFGDRPYA